MIIIIPLSQEDTDTPLTVLLRSPTRQVRPLPCIVFYHAKKTGRVELCVGTTYSKSPTKLLVGLVMSRFSEVPTFGVSMLRAVLIEEIFV